MYLRVFENVILFEYAFVLCTELWYNLLLSNLAVFSIIILHHSK